MKPIMKMKNITMMSAVVLVFVYISNSAKAVITDVEITPAEPTMEDIISIVTSGVEGAGAVFVTDTDFRTDGTSLELDIFLDVGVFPALTPWSHSEYIGTLREGMYDLTVRTWELPDITDTYSITFDVVPEPTTVLLLAMGILGIRANKYKD